MKFIGLGIIRKQGVLHSMYKGVVDSLQGGGGGMKAG